MQPILILLCSLTVATNVAGQSEDNQSVLRGVVIKNAPFVQQDSNGTFTGFAIDLIDHIAKLVGFQYQLYLVPDGRYGNAANNGTNVTGLIGEVYKEKANFALADLTITKARQQVVNFTIPFMQTKLAALITANQSKGIENFEHLAKRINQTASGEGRKFLVGALKNGATQHYLSKTTNNSVNAVLYRSMVENPQSMARSASEGIQKVHAGDYAFLVESTFGQYLAGQHCNVTNVEDTSGQHVVQFGLALSKQTSHKLLDRFNQAIQTLKSNGTIQALRQKYWTSQC